MTFDRSKVFNIQYAEMNALPCMFQIRKPPSVNMYETWYAHVKLDQDSQEQVNNSRMLWMISAVSHL